MKTKHPTVLIVLDGWGHREEKKHNAIAEAGTPFFDSLLREFPHTLLDASGESVGLPAGTIGNSDVGHMTIGAGKVIDTELVRITKAMKAGEFSKNPALLGLFGHIKKYDSFLHVLGLVSPAGVHSHADHLHGFLKAAKDAGLTKVVVHAFTDGRDTPPRSGAHYLRELENVISDLGIGRIATASGRYYAMDRDKNWERTEKAEAALFNGAGEKHKGRAASAVLEELYEKGAMDEFLQPVVFLDDEGGAYTVRDNDGIFFFNFRSDRTRQLSQKILDRAKARNLYFVTMTEYHPAFESHVVFPKMKIDATLAGEVSKAGFTQAHIAETDKYAHVTYFFNGGREEPHEGEKQILVPSRKDVKNHDEAPEGRAKEIADAAIEALEKGTDFILLNFANADLVGHTANVPAIVTAVQTIDRELERVVKKVLSMGGVAVVTADHGNAEINIDPVTGEKHTAHTLSPVPLILIARPPAVPAGTSLAKHGALADVAPTILALMHLEKPSAMTGQNLLSF